ALANALVERSDQLGRRRPECLMGLRATEDAEQFRVHRPAHDLSARNTASYTCFTGTPARSASRWQDSNSGADWIICPSSRPNFTCASPKAVFTVMNSRRSLRRSAVYRRMPNAVVSRNRSAANLSASASAQRTLNSTPGRLFFIWIGV